MNAASYAWVIVAMAIGTTGCARMFRAEPIETAANAPKKIDVQGQAWDSTKTSPEQVIAQRKAQVEQTLAQREQVLASTDLAPRQPTVADEPRGETQATNDERLSASQPVVAARVAETPAARALPLLTRSAGHPADSRYAPVGRTAAISTPTTTPVPGRPTVQATASDAEGRLVAILRSSDGQTHMARQGATLLMPLDGADVAVRVEHISDGRVLIRRGEEPIILQ